MNFHFAELTDWHTLGTEAPALLLSVFSGGVSHCYLGPALDHSLSFYLCLQIR
jgi:hypothetical protein